MDIQQKYRKLLKSTTPEQFELIEALIENHVGKMGTKWITIKDCLKKKKGFLPHIGFVVGTETKRGLAKAFIFDASRGWIKKSFIKKIYAENN